MHPDWRTYEATSCTLIGKISYEMCVSVIRIRGSKDQMWETDDARSTTCRASSIRLASHSRPLVYQGWEPVLSIALHLVTRWSVRLGAQQHADRLVSLSLFKFYCSISVLY